jgi:hypothetical protein
LLFWPSSHHHGHDQRHHDDQDAEDEDDHDPSVPVGGPHNQGPSRDDHDDDHDDDAAYLPVGVTVKASPRFAGRPATSPGLALAPALPEPGLLGTTWSTASSPLSVAVHGPPVYLQTLRLRI